MIIKQDIRPNKMIWVTFRKEGIHKYPAAATDPKLATGDWLDVSFLGTPHRHIFHFRVEMEVFHDDRDVEFIQAKRIMEQCVGGGAGYDYSSFSTTNGDGVLTSVGLANVVGWPINGGANSGTIVKGGSFWHNWNLNPYQVSDRTFYNSTDWVNRSYYAGGRGVRSF